MGFSFVAGMSIMGQNRIIWGHCALAGEGFESWANTANAMGECSAFVYVDADIECKQIPDENGKNQTYINLYQSELRYHSLMIRGAIY